MLVLVYFFLLEVPTALRGLPSLPTFGALCDPDLSRISEKMPADAMPMPAHPWVLSLWPLRKMESNTEKTLRVVVTVVHTRGSKLAIV